MLIKCIKLVKLYIFAIRIKINNLTIIMYANSIAHSISHSAAVAAGVVNSTWAYRLRDGDSDCCIIGCD